MMKRSVLILFVISLVFASITNVLAFSVESGNVSTICASSTLIVTDAVRGSGTFTVSTSGTAKPFSTVVPSGFFLEDGVHYIYSYITPTSRTSPGTYDLIINVNSGSEEKQITHLITVGDCHESDLTVTPQTLETCPYSPVVFSALLKNRGQYMESFQLAVEGPLKGIATLSDSVLNINPGENKTFTVYVNTSCSSGKYDLTVKAKSTLSLAVSEAKAILDVKPCYEYNLEVPQNYYSICEHSQLQIPLTIANYGTAANKIFMNFKGQSWSALSRNEAEIKPGLNAIVNITASPDFGNTGNFTLSIEAMSNLGYVKKAAEIRINVEKCYDVFLNIAKEKDKFCNGMAESYNLSVKNTGKFNNTYNVEIKGPAWVSIDKSSVSSAPEEEKTLIISANPSATDNAGIFEIIIKAMDPVSKVQSQDSIELTTLTVEDCYKAAISSKEDTINVSRDSAATVLLTVENQGINNASYIIDVSGTGSSFVQLNPGILTLKPGKSETLYLYIFPPANTKEGMYEVNIAARLKDTAILSSKKLAINVIQANEPEENVPGVINETAAENITKTDILSDIGNWFSNAFASIGKFFSSLFTIQSPAAETLANETIVSGVSNETAGTETAENETQTAASETITETAGNETAVNETQTAANETATEAANQTITDENETAANETSTFPIEIGNITIIEVNETASNETLVNLTIESNETAGNLTIVSNETAANETTESSDQAQNFDLKSFLIENKSYIVGAIIIILIILLFATGLWRRIIDFFETEEVEE